MYCFFSNWIVPRRKGAIVAQEGLNLVEVNGLKLLFHISCTLRGGDLIKRRMGRPQRTGQVLRGKHLDVRHNREHLSLCMQMSFGCHSVRAGGDPDGRVLDTLKLDHVRSFYIWHPDRSGEIEDRADDEFEGGENSFAILTPGCSGEGLQHLQPRRRPLPHFLQMAGEGEEGVKNEAQDPGVLIQLEKRSVEEDLRVIVILVRKRGEERDLGFLDGDLKLQASSPFGDELEICVERLFDD